MNKLTPAQVETVMRPGLYRVDRTLYLTVRPSGSRAWIQRIRVNGKQTDYGLGPYPEVSIQEAKAKALARRAELYRTKAGIQTAAPVVQVQAPRRPSVSVPTFAEAMTAYLEIHAPTLKNARDVRLFRSRLETYGESLLPLPVNAITKKDVLKVLLPIWHDKRPTARSVRQHIRAVLSYCESNDLVQGNVAGPGIDGALPKNGVTVKNRPAVDYRQMSKAIEAIETGVASPAPRLALLYMIHTAVRPNEAKNAAWSEIDLANMAWTIPADRMKTGKTHTVPLSTGAVAILQRAKALDNGSGLIFPSEMTGKELGRDQLNVDWKKVRGEVSEDSTVHGFRSSFRTWVADQTSHDWTTAEKALSHAVGDSVARAYDRAKEIDKLRTVFQDWSDYLNS